MLVWINHKNMTTNQLTKKQRIDYIDALRGFTMILVVCVHTATFSRVDIFPYSKFFELFRMPLFFFISGFILYKKERIWNLSNSINFLSKKFLVQIIPTAIFMSIHLFVFSKSRIDVKLNGYWFTVALFEFFVVYVLFNFLIRKQKVCNVALLICALFLFRFSFSDWCRDNYPFIYNYMVSYSEYFIYFIIGNIVKKHFDKVKLIFNNNPIMMIGVVLMFIGAIFFLKGYCSYLIIELTLSTIGIFSIFYFFMKNGEYMENSRIGKALQFIGRRTLDVYLLHYFFVNNSIAWIKTFNFNSPTIIFIISIATSLVIIGICLLVSKFLRTNDLLGKILFGAKLPQKASQNS